MNSIQLKKYWLNERNQKFNGLFEKLEEYQTETRGVMQSSLLLIVSILGITTSFSSQNKDNTTNWKITWACMLTTIVYGVSLLIIDHYLKKKYDFIIGIQAADKAEIELKYHEGKISPQDKEKLMLAAMSLLDDFESKKKRWNKEGTEVIEHYRPRLFWSGKLKPNLTRLGFWGRFIYHRFKKATVLYYSIYFISFASLLYALMTN